MGRRKQVHRKVSLLRKQSTLLEHRIKNEVELFADDGVAETDKKHKRHGDFSWH